MLIPDSTKSFQEPFAFLALIDWIISASSRKGGDDPFSSHLNEVALYKLADTVVEHLSVLIEAKIVSMPVVLLIGETVRVIIMDLGDCFREGFPSLFNCRLRLGMLVDRALQLAL